MIQQLERTLGPLGGYDSDDDDYLSTTDETMLQCAQPRPSLLTLANLSAGRSYEALEEPTMDGRLVKVKDYHASIADSTITPPTHTYPTCKHCPGLLPGYHYCKETGLVVQRCEDCEITTEQIPVDTATTSTPATKPMVPTPEALTSGPVLQVTTMTVTDTATKIATATRSTSMRIQDLEEAYKVKLAGETGPRTTGASAITPTSS